MAKETHYRKGRADRRACSPVRRWICSRFPPSRTTRSVGGEEGRQGRACADRRQLLPRWPLVARLDSRSGLRAFDVTIRTQDGRTCARLPRVYGDSPGHGAQPRHAPARVEPQDPRMDRIPPSVTISPDKLRIAIDRMDAKTRRTTFRVIATPAPRPASRPPSGPRAPGRTGGTRSTRPV